LAQVQDVFQFFGTLLAFGDIQQFTLFQACHLVKFSAWQFLAEDAINN